VATLLLFGRGRKTDIFKVAPKAHAVSHGGDILDGRPGLRKGSHILLESHMRINYTRMDSRYSTISSVSVYSCAFPSAYLYKL
jgi:hypothetical protein